MLNSTNAIATIAVKDLRIARTFYESKLGFKPWQTDDTHFITYKSGNGHFLVYASRFAGGYKASVATWSVGPALETTVTELREKGVPFEHYDFLGGKREGDIHIFGEMKNAWCTDPDGNILSLTNV